MRTAITLLRPLAFTALLLTLFAAPAAQASSHLCPARSSAPTTDPRLTQDCNTLLEVKDTLRGTATLNWDRSTAISSWTGVIHNSTSGVTQLNLAAKSLTGTIPRELGNLANLIQLVLDGNDLTGSVPKELGNLTNVETFHLNSNDLDGSIPKELGNLTNVKYLYLHNNDLTGSIPKELGNLTNLEDLRLHQNDLDGSIPKELGNLTNLQNLYLSQNDLDGSIPKELGSLTNLRNLYLYENELTGSIPKELGNLTNLQQLNLEENKLDGSIPKELGNLTNLQQLYLYDNRLTGSIPKELGNLANLQRLYLFSNKLTGAIPTQLGNLTSLRQLVLSDNALTGGIPVELGSLTNLRYLYLNSNKLTGTIPAQLGNLTNLTRLRLDDNALTGGIPVELGSLTNLQWLILRQNRLSGAIPTQLGSLTSLQFLYLSDNNLTGAIPIQLGSLANLQRLHLHRNELTGAIPTQLGSLAALRQLALHCNDLSGTVPQEIGAIATLTLVYLYGNPKLDLENLPANLEKAGREVLLTGDCSDPASTTDDGESDQTPRLTVTLTCPTGVTEGDTLRCTLTLKNMSTRDEKLTNVSWRLPTLGIGPQTLTTGWPRDPPGELKPDQSVSLLLAYGPLRPRRGPATLAVTPGLGGATTQPARVAAPWPAPLPFTVIVDSKETAAVTLTHVVDVRALAPWTFAPDGRPAAPAQDKAVVKDEVVVKDDEVTHKATAGPPRTALLGVTLKRSRTDGHASTYTLTITNLGRSWLTDLRWWSPALRSRRQVGDDGRLRPGASAVVELPYQPAHSRAQPALLSVIVDAVQTGAVVITHIEPASESTVAAPAPMAASTTKATADENGGNDESGGAEEILATVTSSPPRSPLQVALQASEEPVAVGQDAHYTLIITNTSRYWSLTNLRWSSPTLGIDRRTVDDGTLRPGQTVVMRLAYGPADVRWEPATLAAGRIYGGRRETVRLEPLAVPWPAPLPLMLTVSGRLKFGEDEYHSVTAHASYVSALHAPPLAHESAPVPAGEPASLGIAAARAVRAAPSATPLDISFRNAFNPRTPLYPLLFDFLGGTVLLAPEIRAPAGMITSTASTLAAYLVAAPPAPLERAPVGATTAMLDVTPRTRIGGQFVKRREYENGVVRSLVGNAVVALALRDAAGSAVTQLDKPLELRAYLPGSRLPPGVRHTDLQWARWDTAQQQWQPLETRSEGDHLIGAAQQLGLFGVIAKTPPSRDLESGLRYYYTTGKHVGFAFKEYFDAHGGVARFGYPLTNEFQRAGLTVQYFEKARFEYRPRPDGAPPAITLGLLGDELLTLWNAQRPRAAEPGEELPPTARYFPETGHSVAHGFLTHFRANGGVERFGFPVTGEFYDPELGRTVQYFQRQRLAWNTEAGRVEEMPDIARILILAGDPIR